MATEQIKKIDDIVVRFAGDSGDGMQLSGTLFSDASALTGNDIATFPDYPAEIRAPHNTIAGVSGYQVHVGSFVNDFNGDTLNLTGFDAAGSFKLMCDNNLSDSIDFFNEFGNLADIQMNGVSAGLTKETNYNEETMTWAWTNATSNHSYSLAVSDGVMTFTIA